MVSICLLVTSITLSVAQQNTDAAGGNATGAGGSVSYSVGQIDYTYQEGSNGNIHEGVQQPYEIFTFGVEDASIQWGLTVYPNPSTHILYLKVEKEELKNLSYQLFDLNGKLIQTQNINNNITEILMETYSTSTYFLKIYNNTQELTTFKIIKK